MARDYKNRSSRKRDAGTGMLTGVLTFIAGIITGLCVAVIVYFVNGVPQIDGIMDQRQPAQQPHATREQFETPASRDATPTPKFDFYTILPEMEVSVPEWQGESETFSPASSGEDPPSSPIDTGDRYILQIGSFRQPDEAERVKAQLALLGIETEIQRVSIDGGDIWHRVRAGPYQSTSKLNQARSRLIENDIDFLLLKLKREG